MCVRNLLKGLLVILVLASISQNAAHAGKKRFGLSVNRGFSIQLSGQIARQKYGQRPVRSFQRKKQRLRLVQNSNRRISPSAALRAAQRASPGSQGLGVRYMRGRKGYIVKLKTRGSVRSVFVDARTGRVRR